MKRILLLFLLLFYAFFSSQEAFSQIIHPGNGTVCFNDLAHFSYRPPTGKNVSSYQWKFGDGYTSQNPSPFHLYKRTGDFRVSVTVQFSGGGSNTETYDVEVLSLPKADFEIDQNSILCQYDELTFYDRSTKAGNRDIATRNILWGNGIRTQHKSSIPSTVKFTYQSADSFDVEWEIIDSKGCKSVKNKKFKVHDGVKADWSSNFDNSNCTDVKLCLTNASQTRYRNSTSFYWEMDTINSTQDHYNTPLCRTYSKSKIITVSLEATTKDGCYSKKAVAVKIDVEKRNHDVLATDSIVCFSQGSVTYYAKREADEAVKWYVNGVHAEKDTSSNFVLNFEKYEIDTGSHTIVCEIRRGKCIDKLVRKLKIRGPVARPFVYNRYQCTPQAKVFFIADIENGHNPNWNYQWYVDDSKGEQCTINRAKNHNKYKNCNTTIGWFAKHTFSETKSYMATLTVTDPESGCSDSKSVRVYMNACGNCNGSVEPIKVCQGDWFIGKSRQEDDPVKFSFDNGKTWMTFPSKLPWHYVGWYDLSLIYQRKDDIWVEDYGDDSIRIHRFPNNRQEMVTFKNGVYVEPTKSDTVSLELSSKCEPVIGTVKLKSGAFKPGEKIEIDWGPGENPFSKEFTSETVEKEFTHEFSKQGMNDTIRVTLTSANGCYQTYDLPVKFGFYVEVKQLTPLCQGRKVCFHALVKDFSTDEPWHHQGWDGTTNWYQNGKLVGEKTFNYCGTYNDVGEYELKLITKSARGCKDTLDYKFNIGGVKAGVTKGSMLHYCRGQREFFDSSYTKLPSDKISEYKWDFGSGEFSTLVKDPIFSFDGKQKKVRIKHVVRTHAGCVDTFEFDLRVLKSHPSAFVADSIGCAPFTATIKNKSLGASHYIWEMGDPANTTVQTQDTLDVEFTYKTPGRYFINLIGIDSFFNSVNGQIYYCYTKFPGEDDDPVSVLVLPSAHAGISGPDKICVNDEATFITKTIGEFDRELWRIDGKIITTLPGQRVKHTFQKRGTYTVELSPQFMGHNIVPQCISAIEKEIIVEGVEADFSFAELVKPNYQFTNETTGDAIAYAWNFGDPDSGPENNSSAVHPQHNFGTRNGNFNVCLIATTSAGCVDKVCKSVSNWYQQQLDLYNVFTPGEDGQNDTYVVQLRGESYHNFTIYNRWGEIVFHSEYEGEYTNLIEWNGKVNNTGSDCPEGAYFYVLEYAMGDEPDKFEKRSGTVTLIRD